MAEIVVMGAGLNGLTTGMLLARDGHRVTVLERDAAAPRGSAGELWQRWERRGVNQFRQLHFMLPRWRALMERELPAVIAELEAMGGARTNLVGALPAEMTGGWREGDERFETVTARRPVLEAAVAAVAEQTPGLTIRRGVTVTGLVTGPESVDGVPHVTGVLTGEATATRADLVVDATGRRSPVSGMLEAIGARRPAEEREDCGFVYYTRHFRSADGRRPAERDIAAAALRERVPPHPALRLRYLGRGVHHVRSRQATPRAPRRASLGSGPGAVPHHRALGRRAADHRRAGDRRHRGPPPRGSWWTASRWSPAWSPSATHGPAPTPRSGGELPSGCCTPAPCATCSARSIPAIQARLARRFDEITQTTVEPLYRATLQFDRHRLAEIDGEITGKPYRTSDATWEISKALYAGAAHDPDVLRAYASVASLTAMPEEALAEPGLLAKVVSLGSSTPRYPAPGPSRAELLAAMATVTPRP